MASSGVREQVGRIGTLPVRLADLPRPYSHILADSVEIRRDIAGTDTRAEAQRTTVREWKLDDWSGGFGNPTWRSDQANVYNFARNVAPEFRTTSYGGLTLGPYVAVAGDDSPSATFNPTGHFGRVYRARNASDVFSLFGSGTQALYPWLQSSAVFDATAITAGSAAGVAIDVVDPNDGYVYVLDSTDYDLYQVDLGAPANVLHFDRSASSPRWSSTKAAMATHRGEVYVLGGQGDLLRVSRSATNTATKVVDAFYSEIIVEANYSNRITSSDVGLIWFHPTVGGVDIWEYNVGEDSSAIINQISTPVFPWGIAFIGGFTFIGYSTSLTAEAPNVYVKYFRGGQEGVLGPFTDQAEAYAVTFGGAYQDRFLTIKSAEIVNPDAPFELFAYDLAEGAQHHWATGTVGTSTHSAAPGPPLIHGKHLLVPSSSGAGAYRVELVDLERYSTVAAGSAYLDTGRYDFDLPGTLKLLTDVTVTLDPLPANTSVQIQYSLDGGSWQNNGMDLTTDGATTTTFSMATQNDTFYELELRILLNTTAATAAPVIRSVTARALPVSVQEYWDLSISLNPQNYDTSFGSDFIHPDQIVAELQDLKTDKVTVTFSNPWEVDMAANNTIQSETVIVQTVNTPDIGGDETQRYARVRLMKASLS